MVRNKKLKFLWKLLLILAIVLSLVLALLIFAMGNILAFNYVMICIAIVLFLSMLYWIRYRHVKSFSNMLVVLGLVIATYISTNLYIMSKGIYLDGSSILWMNGHVMTQEGKTAFTTLLGSLKPHQAHVQKDPTYSISFTARGDFDPRHLHVFRDKGLIYQGCLLGLESGLDLEGYQLTKEADKLLQELDRMYSP